MNIPNLLPRRLTEEEVEKVAKAFLFTYSISEGAFIAPDCSVVIYLTRAPYQGTMAPYKPIAQIMYWVENITKYMQLNFH